MAAERGVGATWLEHTGEGVRLALASRPPDEHLVRPESLADLPQIAATDHDGPTPTQHADGEPAALPLQACGPGGEFPSGGVQESRNSSDSAFDALQIDGTELLALPYAERRRRLEVLFAARALTSPWTLCPMTTDPATAQEWLEDWTEISGVEGLVLKNLSQRYRPGARGWTKIRRRDTSEAIVGAITGTLARPGLLVLGRHAADRTPPSRRPHRSAAPRRGPRARRPPHRGRPRPSLDRREILLGLGNPRHPRHHPRRAGPRRGDQRRHLRRPGWGLPASDPVRAPGLDAAVEDVPRFGGSPAPPDDRPHPG
ncbi:hypothetical protein [Streptomyces sp. ISL-43]|uniref:ATP-dependent DNA ligase n=1 Tax=Streptomyces sp. ISL-43 TaxID=2819183 RepID=UPI002035F2BA|nr:hypothetical protein [Streptomyces sp. ISL-43]